MSNGHSLSHVPLEEMPWLSGHLHLPGVCLLRRDGELTELCSEGHEHPKHSNPSAGCAEPRKRTQGIS